MFGLINTTYNANILIWTGFRLTRTPTSKNASKNRRIKSLTAMMRGFESVFAQPRPPRQTTQTITVGPRGIAGFKSIWGWPSIIWGFSRSDYTRNNCLSSGETTFVLRTITIGCLMTTSQAVRTHYFFIGD